MTFQPGANVYTQGFGSRPENIEVPVIFNRAPTPEDINFPLGKRWLWVGESEWVLIDFINTQGVITAVWKDFSQAFDLFINGNLGTSQPILGQYNILGQGTASPQQGQPILTSANANTITIIPQVTAAIASGDVTKAGLSTFNENDFTVDASTGFVSSIGGGFSREVGVDTSTSPGTNPVIPDVDGLITVTGGQVPSGTTSNVIQTDSLAVNEYTIQIQQTNTAASSSPSLNGVAHFNSSDFIVDNTGFVSVNTSPAGETITGNTGGPLSPTLGNWNIISANTTGIFAGSGNTLTQDFIDSQQNVGVGTSFPVLNTGIFNTCFGDLAGNAITSGGQNTFIGSHSGIHTIASQTNTGLGSNSLQLATSGNGNTAIGNSALANLLTGSRNTTLGLGAGSSYSGSESNNILIENFGVSAESNKIRIGTPGSGTGQQNQCFIAGITGVTAAGSPVAVSSTGQLSDLGFGTSTQVLTSNGAGVSPTWQSASASSISITADSGGAQIGDAFTFTGGTTGLSFSGASDTFTLGGDLVVAHGGTSATSFNINGAVYSNTTTTGALQSTTLSSGQLLIGGTTTPAAANLTAGTGITILNANNSITISSSGGGIAWSDTSGTVNAAVSNGYFITATCTSTLPASASQGDTISYCVDTASILTITANTGQFIRLGSSLSVSGGTCANTSRGDSITLVYRSAVSTWFAVPGTQGTWQVQTS